MNDARYRALAEVLRERRYFKVVCAAGNEDPIYVRRLSMVYALAGATAIDVSANIDVVRGAVEGVDTAVALAPRLGREIPLRPFVNVSIGLAGDPHIRKARIIAERCTGCEACRNSCPVDAIDHQLIVDEVHCIGCGDCAEPCAFDAIDFYSKRADSSVILPQCMAAGAETLELHAATADQDGWEAEWRTLNAVVDSNYVSICLDRSHLSDKQFIARTKQAYDISQERLMVQADGIPMSGGSDDFNCTLQAIATADLMLKSGIPAMVTASGGTNSKTRELADLCNVKINGVAVGMFARRIVKTEVAREDFDTNTDLIVSAVVKAANLIGANLGACAAIPRHGG